MKFNNLVLVERMPEALRESHRAASNWGTYPHNGSERVIMTRSEAENLDDDEYDRVVRDATLADLERYGELVSAIVTERGNGFPDPGDLVPGAGDLYRLVRYEGQIQTGRAPGEAPVAGAKVVLADWDELPEGEAAFEATVDVDEDDEVAR